MQPHTVENDNNCRILYDWSLYNIKVNLSYWSAFWIYYNLSQTQSEGKPGKKASSLLSNFDLRHLKNQQIKGSKLLGYHSEVFWEKSNWGMKVWPLIAVFLEFEREREAISQVSKTQLFDCKLNCMCKWRGKHFRLWRTGIIFSLLPTLLNKWVLWQFDVKCMYASRCCIIWRKKKSLNKKIYILAVILHFHRMLGYS